MTGRPHRQRDERRTQRDDTYPGSNGHPLYLLAVTLFPELVCLIFGKPEMPAPEGASSFGRSGPHFAVILRHGVIDRLVTLPARNFGMASAQGDG